MSRIRAECLSRDLSCEDRARAAQAGMPRWRCCRGFAKARSSLQSCRFGLATPSDRRDLCSCSSSLRSSGDDPSEVKQCGRTHRWCTAHFRRPDPHRVRSELRAVVRPDAPGHTTRCHQPRWTLEHIIVVEPRSRVDAQTPPRPTSPCPARPPPDATCSPSPRQSDASCP